MQASFDIRAMRANPLRTAALKARQQFLARHLSRAPGASSRCCTSLKQGHRLNLVASLSGIFGSLWDSNAPPRQAVIRSVLPDQQHAAVRSSWATDSYGEPVTLKQQIQRIWPSEDNDISAAGRLQHIHVTGGSAGVNGLLSVAILAAAKLAVPGEIQPWEFTVYNAEDWQREVSLIMLQLQDLYGLSVSVKVHDGSQLSSPWPVVQLMSAHAEEGKPLADIIIAATSAAGIDSLAPRRQPHFDPVASEPDLNWDAANEGNTLKIYLVTFHQAASFVIPLDAAETDSAWKFLYFYANVARGHWAALHAGIGDDSIRRAWSDNKDEASDKDRGCAMSALKLVLYSIVNAIQTPVINAQSAAAALGVSKESLEQLMKVMYDVGLVSSPGTSWRSSWALATDWRMQPYVKCGVELLPDWQEQYDTIGETLGGESERTYQSDELLGLLLGCSTQQVKATSSAAWRDQVLQGMLRLGWVRPASSECNDTECDCHRCKAKADDDTEQWEATGDFNEEDVATLCNLLHGVESALPGPCKA